MQGRTQTAMRDGLGNKDTGARRRSSIGLHPNSTGPRRNSTGLHPSSTGPRRSSTGLHPSSTGPRHSSIGLHPNSTGPRRNSIGPHRKCLRHASAVAVTLGEVVVLAAVAAASGAVADAVADSPDPSIKLLAGGFLSDDSPRGDRQIAWVLRATCRSPLQMPVISLGQFIKPRTSSGNTSSSAISITLHQSRVLQLAGNGRFGQREEDSI